MRRNDREVTDRREIDRIIRAGVVCRLAFAVDGEPYLVPVSFGYDGECIYFHTAESGRKIDCIAANNRVCFEFEHDVRLITHPERPCNWGFDFESVIGFGAVEELLTPDEKSRGLDEVMRRYSDKAWQFDRAALRKTRVWRISIDSVTGKRARPKGV